MAIISAMPTLLTMDMQDALDEFERVILSDYFEGKDQQQYVLLVIRDKHKDGQQNELHHGIKMIFPAITKSTSNTKQYKKHEKNLSRTIESLEKFYSTRWGRKESDYIKYRFFFIKEEKDKPSAPRDLRLHFDINKNYKDPSFNEKKERQQKREGRASSQAAAIAVRKRPISGQKASTPELISLILEHRYFKFRYRPWILKNVVPLLIPIIIFLGIFGFLLILHGRSLAGVGLGCLLFVAAPAVWPMVLGFYRLPDEEFASFYSNNIFIKIEEGYVIVASYSGECPVCHKRLKLVFSPYRSLISRVTYYAKCQEPGHTFPPDKILIEPVTHPSSSQTDAENIKQL